MKRTILSVLILCSMLFDGSGVAARAAQEPQQAPKIDPAKEADIRHLLDLTGAAKIGVQVGQQMSQALRPVLEQSLPAGQDRSKTIVDTFMRKFQTRLTPQALIDLTVPIYDKHFSAEEVRGLIQFYESPLGKRMIAESPAIAEEAGVAGKAWASQVVLKVFAEMETDYPELKQFEETPAKKP